MKELDKTEEPNTREKKCWIIERLCEGVFLYLRLEPERRLTHNFAGRVTGEQTINREVWVTDVNQSFHFYSKKEAEDFANYSNLFQYYEGIKAEEHEFISI